MPDTPCATRPAVSANPALRLEPRQRTGATETLLIARQDEEVNDDRQGEGYTLPQRSRAVDDIELGLLEHGLQPLLAALGKHTFHPADQR